VPDATVVCIGIATLDAIAVVDRLPERGERHEAVEARLAGGGVAATAAVALARLGVDVAFIGRVGDDAAGGFVRDALVADGVEVSGLRVVPGRTPVSLVLVEAGSGERTLVPDVRGLPPLELDDRDVERARYAAWVHVDQTGHPAIARLAAAGVAARVSLDGGNSVRRLDLAGVDLYAPTEAALLARHPGILENALEAALAEGPSLVVATRGAAGSVAGWRRDDGAIVTHAEPAVAGVDIVSTLGAGDAFHGALLAALVRGDDVPQALRWANAAGALACRALDGRTALPTTDELTAFLGQSARRATR
jgi:sulfofructose kinase